MSTAPETAPGRRESIAALALIRRKEGGRTLWLARWNRKWGCYNFVGGHKEVGESFRECVVREVEEETGLCSGVEFTAADAPAAHLEYDAWSESAHAETHYVIELFDVTLAEGAGRTLDADESLRWLSDEEIAGRACADGRPVSATMSLLLEKLSAHPGCA